MHIKLISLTIVEHQDSLRNREKQQLGNGPFGEGDNERGQLHQPAEVKGNVRRNLEFWAHIGAPKFILSVIANGYCLPFQCTPVCISLIKHYVRLKI